MEPMELERLKNNPEFQLLVEEVQKEFDALDAATPDRNSQLELERAGLESQCNGWLMSLADPKLAISVRQSVNECLATAQDRIASINGELTCRAAQLQNQKSALDPRGVAEGLNEMTAILASENPSAVNVMLSQHIEGIYCDTSGKVRVRTCRLGALAGALPLLPRNVAGGGTTDSGGVAEAVTRRLTRRDIAGAIEDDDQADAAIDFAVDPGRFAGLGQQWFHDDEFEVPRRQSWAARHAAEVAAFRLESNASMERTAEHFGKTVPTIREALRHAKDELGIDAMGKAVSRPTLPNWSKAHAREVADFIAAGRTIKSAASEFGKSEPTIRKALEFARRMEPRGS